MERVILHCDCNAFFASVETVLNPALAGVPMAVCGDPAARHGIILAKNELAKGFGVQTAETIGEALRKCPSLTLVVPHHRLYEEYSRKIFSLYNEYSDQVEPFGIDEAWLDVTGSRALFGDGKTIADSIRNQVRKRFGLTVSVGVSFNKVFAKLASDYKKPDATTVFSREDIPQKVFPLPVGDLLFVGKRAESALKLLGIRTIGELAKTPRAFLSSKFGKFGETLSDYASGEENSPVAVFGTREELKSVGNTITFRRDLHGEEDIRTGLLALADKVASRLRADGFVCCGVCVVIKDPAFKTITRQCTLPEPTNLSRTLFDAAYALLRAAWGQGKAIRMLGITGIRLLHATEVQTQISLFEEQQGARKKHEKMECAMDEIRAKFGKDAICSGTLLKQDDLL